MYDLERETAVQILRDDITSMADPEARSRARAALEIVESLLDRDSGGEAAW